ncbi:MAG: S41 family peptidase [Firmicutes bacterium]|nr:S41 family peptidase [Bacillota bacterium]
MTQKRRLVAGIILLMVFVSFLALPARVNQAEETQGKDPNWLSLIKVMDLIKTHALVDVSLQSLWDGALKGLVGALGDPYSIYMDSKTYRDFQTSLAGSFSGIGIYIEMKDGWVTVLAPIKGSPAEGAGLQAGDVITAVDGQSLEGKSLEAAQSLIRGEPGTQVTLTIRRLGEKDLLTRVVQRARISIPNLEGKLIDGNIAYIQVFSFSEGVTRDFKVTLDFYVQKGAKALVLDLRDNPGGLLSEAMEMGQDLLPAGPIVQIVGRAAEKEVLSGNGPGRSLPIAVLVNERSASAAEIVAGALQDRKAAVLVGTRTFGKGTVQSVAQLENGGALKLTTARYLTPTGRSIQGVGLEPDVVVEWPAPAEWAPLKVEKELGPGKIGLEVLAVQERLRQLGFDAGPADGVFGPLTRAAVASFQKAHGFSATGLVDKVTVEALNQRPEAQGRKQADPQLDQALEILRAKLGER